MKNVTNIRNVDDDLPLPAVVTKTLSELGHQRPNDWTRHLHPDAFTVVDKKVQRFLINRCLRIVLGKCNAENTLDERYCLVDTGEISDWIRLFKTGVAPCLVRNNLPEAIN